MPQGEPQRAKSAAHEQQANRSRRRAAQDAARQMGADDQPQHLSEDEHELDAVDAASADSFPTSDPPASQGSRATLH